MIRAHFIPRTVPTLLTISVLVLAALGAAPPTGAASDTLIRGAWVFDGNRSLGITDVLVSDGHISRVGNGLTAPVGAVIVEGKGKTLLPGLIDAHVHAYGDATRTALTFGVTTELDMFTNAGLAASIKADQAAGKRLDEADLRSAGTLATAPGGHGTEYGFPIPTLSHPEEAQAWVDARIKEGSDYIKIVIEDGSAVGLTLPTLDEPTVKALVAAAHARGKLAVVHITTLAAAREAINAGADGLAHLFVDKVDLDFGRFAAEHHIFVVPTLTVLEGVAGGPGSGTSLVKDPRLAPYLPPALSTNLERAFPNRAGRIGRLEVALTTVAELEAAQVPVLAGTDAPNPGTAHGVSMHRELELLVKAGLSPTQALTAATATPAARFHLEDRGKIAPGLRADLLLVDGDPTTDILATRAIAGVWKLGVRLDLAGRAAEAGRAREVFAALGPGWDTSTDVLIGGHSNATVAASGGAPPGRSGKSLAISGNLAPTGFYGWSGASFSPSGNSMTATDLPGKKALRFWAKGDGRTYQVMLFVKSKGYIPLTQNFVAGPTWQEVNLPFSGFGGFDGQGLLMVVYAAVSPPGTFSFAIHGPHFE